MTQNKIDGRHVYVPAFPFINTVPARPASERKEKNVKEHVSYMKKEGNIKISSENMMPIIKKWLYSDKDIFLREIVSNGTDAITKFRKLVDVGAAPADPEGFEYCVKIVADKDAGTLAVEDNGIGMTYDEVEKYITQIAFSGAADFVSKYEKAGGDGIIGHFGLGFYSAYMVAKDIEIFTKSYQDEPGVHWESDGESLYSIEEWDRQERGTQVVIHLADDEKEFLNESTLKSLVLKYCQFMPYNIYVNPKGTEEDKPVNNPSPLYLKDPKECTEEEYKKFYTDVFSDYNEPLFWVHLNMDYPYRLKGILYFPKVRNKMELERGKVKLYCNQVFIAENIKEVIPEYLMLLNGVIDCPDIPLNVSRSFLQNDRQVQKISKYISKKVADALAELFRNDREKYEKCWDDTSVFVKFGCIKDDEFYGRVKDIIIYKDLSGAYVPLTSQYGEELTDEQADNGDQPKSVYYVSDMNTQAQYVRMFTDAGLNAIVCDNSYLDPHFISYLEYKEPRKVRFMRIDADIDEALKQADDGSGLSKKDEKTIEGIFSRILKEKNAKLTVKTSRLKNESVPAVVNTEEFMRRMGEMNKYYGISEDDQSVSLIVNTANAAVQSVKELGAARRKAVVLQIYYVALLSSRKLTQEEMTDFVANSGELMRLCAQPSEEDGEEPADEEPIGEEPVDEEPVDEEPADEEPIEEEPADEEPIEEEPIEEEPIEE